MQYKVDIGVGGMLKEYDLEKDKKLRISTKLQQT